MSVLAITSALMLAVTPSMAQRVPSKTLQLSGADRVIALAAVTKGVESKGVGAAKGQLGELRTILSREGNLGIGECATLNGALLTAQDSAAFDLATRPGGIQEQCKAMP